MAILHSHQPRQQSSQQAMSAIDMPAKITRGFATSSEVGPD